MYRYDKVVRGYVHVMEGDSITTKIQLPGNDRSSRESLCVVMYTHPVLWSVVWEDAVKLAYYFAVGLLQPFLVLQVSVPTEARFTVELR